MTVKVKVQFDAKGNFKVIDELDGKLKKSKTSAEGLGSMLSAIGGPASTALKIGMVAATAALGGFAFVTKKAVDAAVDLENSLIGLRSVARATGQDVGFVEKAAKDLAQDGLIPLASVSASLKNLMASGLDAKKSVETFNALRNAASFNRQGQLSLAEAVKGATDGIKNQNSIMVDNAGVTKNLSIIIKEYASSVGKSVKDIQGQEKALAIANGIIKEAAIFQGDYNRLLDTFSGATAQASGQFRFLLADYGDAIIKTPQLTQGIKAITEVFKILQKMVNENRKAIMKFTTDSVKFVLIWGATFLRVLDKLIDKFKAVKKFFTDPAILNAALGKDILSGSKGRVVSTEQFGPQPAQKDSTLEKIAAAFNKATTIQAGKASKAAGLKDEDAAGGGAGGGFIDKLKTNGLKLGANILKGAEGARSLLSGAADLLLPGLGGIVTELSKGPEHVQKMVREFTKALPILIKNIIKAIPVLIKELIKAVPELINALVDALPELIDGIIESIPDIINALVDALPIVVEKLAENAPIIAVALASALIANAPDIALAIAKASALAIPKAIIGGLKGGVNGLSGKIGDSGKNFFEKVSQGGKDFFKKIVDGGKKFIDKLLDELKKFFSNLFKGLGSAGGDVGKIFSKIPVIGDLLGGATKVISKPVNVVRSVFKKFGFAEGADIPQGFDNDTFGPAFLSSGEAVITKGTTEKMNDFIDSRLPALENAVATLADSMGRPMVVSSSVELNQREFANIILELNRTNTRLAV